MANWGTATIEFLSLVYYEIIVALVSGAFSEMKPKRKVGYLFFALMPLAIMTMFRADSVGNDTLEYVRLFDSAKNLSLGKIIDSTRYEKGYLLLNYLLSKISENSRIILVTIGAFSYCSLARWLNKWSKAPGMMVCLLVEMLYVDNWMSVMRQTISLFVLLFAFDYLVEHKFWRFLIITLLAAQFHNAAYIFLVTWPILYWFTPKNLEQLYSKIQEKRFLKFVIMGALIVLLCFRPILNFLVQLFPVYSYYVSGVYMDGNSRLAVILKVIVYGLMICVPLMLGAKSGKSDNATIGRIAIHRFALINIILWILANKATIIVRLTDAFAFLALSDYAECVNDINYSKNRECLIVLSVIAFAAYGLLITLLKTPEWQTTYPFKWCF
jgi:hypothetical protein